LKVEIVAGGDVAYDRTYAYGVWVAVRLPGFDKVDIATARVLLTAEYQASFLAKQELHALLAAFWKLKVRPDIVICDGAGKAHPRKFGLACAFGEKIGIPGNGCAKSRLVVNVEEPAPKRGGYEPILMDNELYSSGGRLSVSRTVKSTRMDSVEFSISRMAMSRCGSANS